VANRVTLALSVVSVLLCFAMPRTALAQTSVPLAQFADPDAQPRLRLGPFAVNPSIALTDVGVDTNVYSSATDPQQDFTAKLSPGVDIGLRMGRARLSSKTTLGFNYFQKATRYRTLDDVTQDAQIAVPLNRLTPRLVGTYARTRNRPSLEIDTRVRQFTRRFGAETDVRVGPKLQLTLGAARTSLRYENESFRDVALQGELDRVSDQAGLDIRYALTPLTTFVTRIEAAHDRFDVSHLRDADIRGAVAGFELKPAALISGRGVVGYRRVDLRSSSLPDFSGVVLDLQAAYTLLGRTRFDLTGRRSVEYSYQPAEPYYVLTGAGLTITQALGRGWDIRALGSRDNLGYRRVGGGSGASHVDRSESLGGGIGKRLGTEGRLGFDIVHAARHSLSSGFEYAGWRVGGSFTYGQ
jgi:hypothetical protein